MTAHLSAEDREALLVGSHAASTEDYGNCIVCGAKAGQPCDTISEPGTPRAVPHFYRAKLSDPGPAEPFVAIVDEGPYPVTGDQDALAEAIDDLVFDRGVALDDGRLDWLAGFVAAHRAEAAVEVEAAWVARVEALADEWAAREDRNGGYIGTAHAVDRLRALLPEATPEPPC